MYQRLFAGLLTAVLTVAAHAYNFSISPLQGVTFTAGVTSLQFGPDHRLYAAQVNGQIRVLTVQRLGPNNYQVTATETINLVRDIPNYDDDGTRNTSLTTRQVTGLLVTGTASNPVLYVTSSDPRIGGGSGGVNDLNLDTNSGIVSRLTRTNGVWSKVDLVRGLPRSEENHASNGMQLDAATNTLYLAQGGNTNAGGPSNNFAFMCETALAAAILSIDLDAINAMAVKTDDFGQKYLYDLPTLDDPSPTRTHNPDGSDLHDPFGGNDGLNQARLVEDGPVQVYSPGWRNPYDLVITRTPGREGRMYAWDNGPNQGWGGYPHNEGASGTVTNQYLDGEPGAVNNKDNLHRVTAGYYAGHPNPIRANPAGAGWFYYDATQPAGAEKIYAPTPTTDWPPVPLSMANPVEGDYRQPGVDDGALLTYPASTNGLTEYLANNFSGEMRGNLIAASYDGKLLRIALSADGNSVTNGAEPLASGFGTLPLDITAPDPIQGAPFVGTIWVSHYAPAKISILEPADFDSPGGDPCTGINSAAIDEDGDGYSNADEIANDSDPCSAAIRPPDIDEDGVSDQLDTDDDNDGTPDLQDPFPIDPLDGRSVPLPLRYDLFNETGVGFFGVGMTGLMMNPGQDYLALISPDNVIAGGTAGLFTLVEPGPGRALGSSNNQKDAYHFAFNSDEFTTPYVISSRLGGPFFGSDPTGQQAQGIYLGNGDQDNYISVALHANDGAGGIEVVHESEGVVLTQQVYPISGLDSLTTVDLFLTVDPIAATVQPGYRLSDSDPITQLGAPFTVSDELLLSIMGPDPLAIGLFATTGAEGTPTFAATWDYFDIDPINNTAIAKFTIDPPVTDMATASTYTNGGFKIQNSSTGGQHIESATVDLSTAIFPDMVYDPDGTAGDPDHKGFTPNGFQNGVSGASGANSKPHNGVDGEDGYDQLDIAFNAFPPGGLFTFSIDVDPTNVKGVAAPGQNHAASVSGLELIGATVQVFFSDGSVHRTRLGRLEGTVDASYGWLRSQKPPKPGISVLGKTAPFTTGEPEIVRVAGPAGLDVTLTTLEGALYIGGVPGGGYDLDPYEANTAIKISEQTGVIPTEGFLDFTVTGTKSDADGGYNFVTAILSNADGIKGPVSDGITWYFDPSLSGDTQPPSAPGALLFSNVTANSLTVSWTAASDNVGVTSYRVSRDGALVGTVTGLSFNDSALSPGTAYEYSVVAVDAATNTSAPSTATVSTLSGGSATAIRINAGGPEYVDQAGNTWIADAYFNTGLASNDGATVTGTTDPQLFKKLRWDDAPAPELTYSIPLPNGAYTVRLHMAETAASGKGAGLRVFDVDIQSIRTFEDVDIFTLAGGANKALVLEANTTVTDGQLQISFLHQVNHPRVHAIEVLPNTPPDDSEPPTAPGALSFTGVAADSVTVNWTAATDNEGVTGYRVSRDGEVLDTVTGLSFTDETVEPDTAYAYSVVALDAAGNVSPASTGDVTTPPGAGTGGTVIRVNAGGPAYVDNLGRTWSADTGYNTGKASSSTVAISGTSDPALYYSNRYDEPAAPELKYTFAVPNGSYHLRLHFAEIYGPLKAPGKRVFDIDVEGARAFEDVDIFVLAGGGNTALVLETDATVNDGQLTIDFLHQVENPKINAIEILSAATPPADTEPPTQPGALSFSNVTTSSVTVTWGAASDNVDVTGYRVSRDGALLTTVTGTSFADTGLSAATSYNYSVVAIDAAGNASPASAGTITTASGTPPATALRVNAGGPAYVDSQGRNWSADTGYNTGKASTTTVAVSGTTDPVLYHSNRFDEPSAPELAYTFTVPNGSYQVRLHFAEIYGPLQTPGKRVFDIDVQGTRAFEDVDIFVLAGGGNKALVLETTATVANGQLKIDFLHQVQNPKINAIEILSTDTPPPTDTQSPSAPGALSFTEVSASSVTVNWNAATDNVGVTGYRVSRNGVVLTTVTGLSFTDTGLTAATSYSYAVEALDAAGNASTASTGTISTASGGPSLPTIRVNAGGSSYVDSAGNTWSADTGYNTGETYSVAGSTGIAATADPALFRSERFDRDTAPELAYAFTVPNGNYVVRLYFAEVWSGAQAAGVRVFDVDIESARAFEDVDIYDDAGGGYRALMLEHTVAVTDGQLNIGFLRQVQNPKINAIEIVPAP